MTRGSTWTLAVVAIVVLATGCGPAKSERSESQLLVRLRTELEDIRSKPMDEAATVATPDVSELVGLPRSKILERLGPPDYCLNELAPICGDSLNWSYFYFNHPERDEGDDVVVTTGGGVALEFEFDARRRVKAVHWQAQR